MSFKTFSISSLNELACAGFLYVEFSNGQIGILQRKFQTAKRGNTSILSKFFNNRMSIAKLNVNTEFYIQLNSILLRFQQCTVNASHKNDNFSLNLTTTRLFINSKNITVH